MKQTKLIQKLDINKYIDNHINSSLADKDRGHDLRPDDEPEVRHPDHADHHAEHADDDPGVLRHAPGDDGRPADRQHRLHRPLHAGVRAEAHRPPALLLQDPLERLRLRRRRPVHSR